MNIIAFLCNGHDNVKCPPRCGQFHPTGIIALSDYRANSGWLAGRQPVKPRTHEALANALSSP
ncbi:hypothetical protein O1Q98_14910 [Dickeya lacustris]|uniref:Uncharacterized protein n=1 Tax=Dickeya lacustris TaxID=2259638 RepID=A0ABY8G4R1_9GAMM|nr:hypothetical protein [Dickeya lacustris]WFN54927.1 hypothetical protein O1Q98_14910 [Dickeya lacustris]